MLRLRVCASVPRYVPVESCGKSKTATEPAPMRVSLFRMAIVVEPVLGSAAVNADVPQESGTDVVPTTDCMLMPLPPLSVQGI